MRKNKPLVTEILAMEKRRTIFWFMAFVGVIIISHAVKGGKDGRR